MPDILLKARIRHIGFATYTWRIHRGDTTSPWACVASGTSWTKQGAQRAARRAARKYRQASTVVQMEV